MSTCVGQGAGALNRHGTVHNATGPECRSKRRHPGGGRAWRGPELFDRSGSSARRLGRHPVGAIAL